MKKTAKELIEAFAKECEKNGYYFLVEVDDHKNIIGKSHAKTNSKLNNMVKAVNSLADTYTETITK